jgi:hypothetical protein
LCFNFGVYDSTKQESCVVFIAFCTPLHTLVLPTDCGGSDF